MTDINRYLDFVLKLFFAFGLAFEIPIATVLLIWTGATTTASMASKRAYVIVGCFVVGMILTPPDIISQVLLALPMWLLFETGILFARIFQTGPVQRSDGWTQKRQTNSDVQQLSWNVTGPSFVSDTFMSAPNRPVSTGTN